MNQTAYVLKDNWIEQMRYDNQRLIEQSNNPLIQPLKAWFSSYDLDVQEKIISGFEWNVGNNTPYLEHHNISKLLSLYHLQEKYLSDQEREYLFKKSELALQYYVSTSPRNENCASWLLLYMRTRHGEFPDQLPIDESAAVDIWLDDTFSSSKEFLMCAVKSSSPHWRKACWDNAELRQRILNYIEHDREGYSFFQWDDSFLKTLEPLHRDELLGVLSRRWVRNITKERTGPRSAKPRPFTLKDYPLTQALPSKEMLTYLYTTQRDIILSDPKYVAAYIASARSFPTILDASLFSAFNVSTYRHLFFDDAFIDALAVHPLLHSNIRASEYMKLLNGFVLSKNSHMYDYLATCMSKTDQRLVDNDIIHDLRLLRLFHVRADAILQTLPLDELQSWYDKKLWNNESYPSEVLSCMLNICGLYAKNLHRFNVDIPREMVLNIMTLMLQSEAESKEWTVKDGLLYSKGSDVSNASAKHTFRNIIPVLWSTIANMYPNDSYISSLFQTFYSSDFFNQENNKCIYYFPYVELFEHLGKKIGFAHTVEDVYNAYVLEKEIRKNLDINKPREDLQTWIQQYVNAHSGDGNMLQLELQSSLGSTL